LTNYIPDDMMLERDVFHSTVRAKGVDVTVDHYSAMPADALALCELGELAAGLVEG
jgi:hypothetical protein